MFLNRGIYSKYYPPRTPYTVHTVRRTYYTPYTVHCTQCTLYSVYRTLYTMYTPYITTKRGKHIPVVVCVHNVHTVALCSQYMCTGYEGVNECGPSLHVSLRTSGLMRELCTACVQCTSIQPHIYSVFTMCLHVVVHCASMYVYIYIYLVIKRNRVIVKYTMYILKTMCI